MKNLGTFYDENDKELIESIFKISFYSLLSYYLNTIDNIVHIITWIIN